MLYFNLSYNPSRQVLLSSGLMMEKMRYADDILLVESHEAWGGDSGD